MASRAPPSPQCPLPRKSKQRYPLLRMSSMTSATRRGMSSMILRRRTPNRVRSLADPRVFTIVDLHLRAASIANIRSPEAHATTPRQAQFGSNSMPQQNAAPVDSESQARYGRHQPQHSTGPDPSGSSSNVLRHSSHIYQHFRSFVERVRTVTDILGPTHPAPLAALVSSLHTNHWAII